MYIQCRNNTASGPAPPRRRGGAEDGGEEGHTRKIRALSMRNHPFVADAAKGLAKTTVLLLN